MYKTFHPWFSLRVFVNFMEKNLFTYFCDCFDFFSWTYEVAKFWMIMTRIKLSFDVIEVMHVNEYT